MKKNKKQTVVVNVSDVKTRVQTPKTVYNRKGRRKEVLA